MNKLYLTKHNESFPELLALPFANLLPTDRIGLLRWRLYVRERCLEDQEFRQQIIDACSQDVVFFCQTFCYFHEVRSTGDEIGSFPALLWLDQKNILALLQKYAGQTDMVVSKTRGIGLSFLISVFYVWLFLFSRHRLEVGLVSKDDASLDVKGRPSTLFGKLDLILEYLPAWMRLGSNGKPVYHRTSTNHRLEHLTLRNAVQGYASTDEKLRSARLFCCAVDEAAFLDVDIQRYLASAYGTTPSMLWISTHNGSGSFFHRLTQDEVSDLVRIETYWWENEYHRRGLYRSHKGQIEFLDTSYDWTKKPDYQFSHENPGRVRSPFADKAFNRPGVDKQVVEEELYGIAAIASRKLIRPEVLNAARQHTTPALARGSIDDLGNFIEDDLAGQLWFHHDPMTPFTGRYFMGCDPALGVTGAALAGLCVIDSVTGMQVVSAAIPDCPPIIFAEIAVRLARFITGAGSSYCKIVAESTGVNVSFVNEIVRLKYPSLYCESEGRVGVHNRDRGLSWLSELGRAIQAREVRLQDVRIIDDLGDFEIESRKLDLVYTGDEGHGDLAIAASLAWHGAKRPRQAVLTTQKNSLELRGGIEAEPLFKQRKQASIGKLYSSRFER